VAPPSLATRLARALGRTLRRAAGDAVSGTRHSPSPFPATQPARIRRTDGAAGAAAYPGDFPGRPPMSFAPHPDGVADPGEVVWTWVPYEEDASQGKDRPVLVVARGGSDGDLLGLMLSSQDRRRDDTDWVSVGSGPWDREGRESFVRLDRVLEIPEHGIRREGAVMPADRFGRVADELRRGYGWS
jgi:hypothetical protein